MQGVARTANSMGCAGWTRRSWKAMTCVPVRSRPSRALSIRSRQRGWSWSGRRMSCLSGSPLALCPVFWTGTCSPRKTSAGPPPRQLRPRAGVSRTLRLHQALVKPVASGPGVWGKRRWGGSAGSVGNRRRRRLDRRRRCHVAGPGGRYAAHQLRVYADNEAGCRLHDRTGESIIRLPSPRKLPMDWRPGWSPAVAAAVSSKGGATHSRCRRRVGPCRRTDDSPFGTAPHMAAGVIGRDGRPLVRSRFA